MIKQRGNHCIQTGSSAPVAASPGSSTNREAFIAIPDETTSSEALIYNRLYTAPKSIRFCRETSTYVSSMVVGNEKAIVENTSSNSDRGCRKKGTEAWKSLEDNLLGAQTINSSSHRGHPSSTTKRLTSRSLSNESLSSSALLSSNSWHSQDSTISSNDGPIGGSNTSKQRRGMRKNDFLLRFTTSHDDDNNLDDDSWKNRQIESSSTIKRFIRSVSWDGNEASSRPFGGPSPLHDEQIAWRDEKRQLLKTIQNLTQQAEAANSKLKKLVEDPNLIDKLSAQLVTAKEEHIASVSQLEMMEVLLKERDQELTSLRLESLERHLSSDHATFSTNPRWDSDDHASSSTITVSTEDYRGLHAQRDTAMMRAGELAHQLAQSQSQVDDLQERLETTRSLLELSQGESNEWKAKYDALTAALDASNNPTSSSKKLAVAKCTTSSTSPRGFGSMLLSRATAPLRSTTQTTALCSDRELSVDNSISCVPVAPETKESDVPVKDAAKQPEMVAESTPPDPVPVMDVHEVLAAELWKLKQQVLRLQEEKAECLSALMASQNELAAWANRVNTSSS